MITNEVGLFGCPPKNSKVYYNYETETARLIEQICDQKNTGYLINIISHNEIIAEKFLQHACKLLPIISGQEVSMIWQRVSDRFFPSEVIGQIRENLYQIWKDRHGGLSYEVNPMENAIFNMNWLVDLTEEELDYLVLPLLKKIHGKILIFVFNIYGEETKKIKFLEKLFSKLNDTPHSNRIFFVLIGQHKLYNTGKAVYLNSPAAEVFQKLCYEEQNTFDKPQSIKLPQPSSESLAVFEKVVLPMLYLDRPATSHVIGYLQDKLDFEMDLSIQGLIRDKVLKPMFNETIALSQEGRDHHSKHWNSGNKPPKASQILIQGTSVLTFSHPTILLETDILTSLEKYSSEHFKTIDYFTGYLCSESSQNNNEREKIIAGLKELSKDKASFHTGNVIHQKSLLAYVSQALLRQPERFSDDLFRIFESLSLNFCDFLAAVQVDSHNNIYESSRWMTNVGYVYDQLHQKGISIPLYQKTHPFKQAVTYLKRLKPKNLEQQTNVAYSLGWQLLDSYRFKEASKVFLDAAEVQYSRTASHIQEGGPLSKARNLSLMGWGSLGFKKPIPKTTTKILYHFLEHSGFGLTLDQLADWIAQGGEKFFGSTALFQKRISAAICFCDFDTVSAIEMADHLLRDYQVRCKLIMVKAQQDLQEIGMTTIVVGAPDTPGEIGKFISSLDPDLAALYQIQLMKPFSEVVIIEGEYKTIILNGCGMSESTSEATKNHWEQHLEKVTMELELWDFLIKPLVSEGSKALREIIVNKLISGSKQGTTDINIKEQLDRIEVAYQELSQENIQAMSAPKFLDAIEFSKMSTQTQVLLGQQFEMDGLIKSLDETFKDNGHSPDVWNIQNMLELMLRISTQERLFRSLEAKTQMRKIQDSCRIQMNKCNDIIEDHDRGDKLDVQSKAELQTYLNRAAPNLLKLLDENLSKSFA